MAEEDIEDENINEDQDGQDPSSNPFENKQYYSRK